MIKIERPNIEQDYNDSKVSTKRIDNYPQVRKEKDDFVQSLREQGKDVFMKRYEEINCLNQSHIEKFTEAFGKEDFIYHNEYEMYAWLVEHDGCECLIFSGEGFGTCIEVVLNDKLRPKGYVKGFFDAYWDMVKNFKYN